MDSDDGQVGRILTRREVLALMGTTGFTLFMGCSSASTATELPEGTCVVRPEQTEGPYFVDELLNRSDIRSDPATSQERPGLPLSLTFNLSALNDDVCTPAPGLFFDIWHCDADGVYSDVVGSTAKFLRGYQVSDSEGRVQFLTIFPGWYQGRTAHIHFKIRSALESSPAFEFTSQLYFDDTLTDAVYTQAPYSSRGTRTTRNSQDALYSGGGSQLILPVTPGDKTYFATMDIALSGVEVPVRPASWSYLKGLFRK